MRTLFDQGTPVPLRRWFTAHHVETAWQRGWAELSNGDLLSAAESAGFELLVTTDQNLRYQQNLSNRRIAVLVLTVANWPSIEPHGAPFRGGGRRDLRKRFKERLNGLAHSPQRPVIGVNASRSIAPKIAPRLARACISPMSLHSAEGRRSKANVHPAAAGQSRDYWL